MQVAILFLMPSGIRDDEDSFRDQCGHRYMWPGQSTEIHGHILRILDLRGVDNDLLAWGLDEEGSFASERRASWRVDIRRRHRDVDFLSRRPSGHIQFVLYRLDPESGVHPRHVSVWFQKCDIGGAAPGHGRTSLRGDSEDGGIQDFLARNGLAEDRIRILECVS